MVTACQALKKAEAEEGLMSHQTLKWERWKEKEGNSWQ